MKNWPVVTSPSYTQAWIKFLLIWNNISIPLKLGCSSVGDMNNTYATRFIENWLLINYWALALAPTLLIQRFSFAEWYGTEVQLSSTYVESENYSLD